MKKIIQILFIIFLVAIIVLIVVFVFNPFDSRTKLIGSIINSYLSSTIEDYTPIKEAADTSRNTASRESEVVADKNPLLNEEQEKTLEKYGVDVSRLPSSISEEMKTCFIEKLGPERAEEIAGGASPSAIEIFKARSCLGE